MTKTRIFGVGAIWIDVNKNWNIRKTLICFWHFSSAPPLQQPRHARTHAFFCFFCFPSLSGFAFNFLSLAPLLHVLGGHLLATLFIFRKLLLPLWFTAVLLSGGLEATGTLFASRLHTASLRPAALLMRSLRA